MTAHIIKIFLKTIVIFISLYFYPRLLSHFIFCHKRDVLPVMYDGIEESVAGGWRGECLRTKSAADYSASVRPYLIANVIEHLVAGKFAPYPF